MMGKKILYGLPETTPSHQEYYKEPFTKVDGGYGFEGVLTVSNEETHVQCHICGRFYTSLGSHVQHSHKIKARDYKQKFGLRLTKGLVSPKYSKQKKLTMANAPSEVKVKRAIGLKKAVKKLPPKLSQAYSLENKNIKGLCPEQLLDKIKTHYSMHETDAGLNRFREQYGGGAVEAVYRTYGSWKNAVILAGFQTNPPKKAMTKQQFIAITRDFFDRHKVQPTYRDFQNRNGLPSHTLIYKLFGSYNKAIQETFNRYPL